MKCLMGEHSGAEVSKHFAMGPLLASTPRSGRQLWECHTISPKQSIYHDHFCPMVMRNELRPMMD